MNMSFVMKMMLALVIGCNGMTDIMRSVNHGCEFPSKYHCALMSGTFFNEHGKWKCYEQKLCEPYIKLFVSGKKELRIRTHAKDIEMRDRIIEKAVKLGIEIQPENEEQAQYIIEYLKKYPTLSKGAILSFGYCFISKWWDNKDPLDFITDSVECALPNIAFAALLEFKDKKYKYSAKMSINNDYVEFQFAFDFD